MKLNRPICILFLCFLANCKSPSDQVKDAFHTVDKSLEESNAKLDNSVEKLYATISSKRQNNPQLALTADTIYFVTNGANNLIDSLKLVMEAADTSGTDITLAAKLLIQTKTGRDLGEAFNKVYYYASSYVIDIPEKQKLDSVLHSFKQIQDDVTWTSKYFENTPTIAAATILTKFKNDCTNAGIIVLSDIEERIK